MDFSTREEYLKRHRITGILEDCVHYLVTGEESSGPNASHATNRGGGGSAKHTEFLLNAHNPVQYLPQTEKGAFEVIRNRLLHLQEQAKQNSGAALKYCLVLCSNRICSADQKDSLDHAASFLHDIMSLDRVAVIGSTKDVHSLAGSSGGHREQDGQTSSSSSPSSGQCITSMDVLLPCGAATMDGIKAVLKEFTSVQLKHQNRLSRQRDLEARITAQKRAAEVPLVGDSDSSTTSETKKKLQQRLRDIRTAEDESLAKDLEIQTDDLLTHAHGAAHRSNAGGASLTSTRVVERLRGVLKAIRQENARGAVIALAPSSLREALFLELFFGRPAAVLWMTKPMPATEESSGTVYFDFPSDTADRFMQQLNAPPKDASASASVENMILASVQPPIRYHTTASISGEDDELSAMAEYFSARGVLIQVNVDDDASKREVLTAVDHAMGH